MMMSENERVEEPSGTIPTPPKPPEKKGRSLATVAVLDLGSTQHNLHKIELLCPVVGF
jgi:hypothetical protein